MKVYATELVNGEVVLNTYPSQKAFMKTERWCDPKFINIATTKDLDGYEFANERSRIVYSDDQKKSQMLIRDVHLKCIK